jgi:hypothetical protein
VPAGDGVSQLRQRVNERDAASDRSGSGRVSNYLQPNRNWGLPAKWRRQTLNLRWSRCCAAAARPKWVKVSDAGEAAFRNQNASTKP